MIAMNGNGLCRPLTVITTYKQSEQIYSDKVRRIRPVWLRPTHPYDFGLLPDVPQTGYKTYVKINREVTTLRTSERYFGHICRRYRPPVANTWTRDEWAVRLNGTIGTTDPFTTGTVHLSSSMVDIIDNDVNEDEVSGDDHSDTAESEPSVPLDGQDSNATESDVSDQEVSDANDPSVVFSDDSQDSDRQSPIDTKPTPSQLAANRVANRTQVSGNEPELITLSSSDDDQQSPLDRTQILVDKMLASCTPSLKRKVTSLLDEIAESTDDNSDANDVPIETTKNKKKKDKPKKRPKKRRKRYS